MSFYFRPDGVLVVSVEYQLNDAATHKCGVRGEFTKTGTIEVREEQSSVAGLRAIINESKGGLQYLPSDVQHQLNNPWTDCSEGNRLLGQRYLTRREKGLLHQLLEQYTIAANGSADLP